MSAEASASSAAAAAVALGEPDLGHRAVGQRRREGQADVLGPLRRMAGDAPGRLEVAEREMRPGEVLQVEHRASRPGSRASDSPPARCMWSTARPGSPDSSSAIAESQTSPSDAIMPLSEPALSSTLSRGHVERGVQVAGVHRDGGAVEQAPGHADLVVDEGVPASTAPSRTSPASARRPSIHSAVLAAA